VACVLQGSKTAATANQATGYLFCVLLLTSLVAVGEAGEVYSAAEGRNAHSALADTAKVTELQDDRFQTRPPPSTGNWLSPAQTQEKHVDDFNPKFPLFPSRLGEIRSVWMMNERFHSKNCSSTGSLFSVRMDPTHVIQSWRLIYRGNICRSPLEAVKEKKWGTYTAQVSPRHSVTLCGAHVRRNKVVPRRVQRREDSSF